MKGVLVVDDTKNIRTLLTKCLQMEGFEVATANDGNEALAMFKEGVFDLAFLDIKMPCYSGTEVLKQIREMGITTPVIIITAYATIKNAVECTRMGAVAYLQKPFTADKIRNVLAELGKIKEAGIIHNYSLPSAEKLLDEGYYLEAMHLLKKILPEKTLDKSVYDLLSRASEGLGRTEDAKKYRKIYEGLL